MTYLLKGYRIKTRDFNRAGEVSIKVQNVLKAIGFDPVLVRRVAICAYESEMNVVMHGGNGELSLTVDPARIILEVRDDGPGIDDIELAMQEGFTTASHEDREKGFGAGMGLPNIRNNSDTFEIYSEKEEGAHLISTFKVEQD
ncbi:MAG: ATP-binding protein [Deltaproteobacteria bacterium]|nr:ATP-binding protein [Deltaproteobacteria bacterium]MBW2285758.1 ATP-binding protein [Deltaproteobacteria bacterium]